MSQYWFAMSPVVTREDFGYKSSEVPAQDLVKDRFLPGSIAWRFRFAKPVALPGLIVYVVGSLGFAAYLLAAGSDLASGRWPLFSTVAIVVLAGLIVMVLDRKTDPSKTSDQYDDVRDEQQEFDPRKPWLRWRE